ncbi:MAG: aldehyde dehydrogenase [candidate division Zixibacteria bacterium RBG_16_50_21]|nr:MAG: aldehyde dehydrogenase [candidate division Zixibacteria bacterium RBG_16_50_21]
MAKKRPTVGKSVWFSPEKIAVTNKYTGQVIGQVPLTTPESLEQTVQSAQKGFQISSDLPAHQRGRILANTSQLIEEEKQEYTRLLSQEAGKPWKDAQVEVERAIQTFQFAAEEAKHISGETVPLDAAVGSEERIGFYLRVPVGIIGAITPFNFPLNLVAHKLAPAIAAGCSVILKPASLTPLISVKLAQTLEQAGLPEYVLGLIFGPGEPVGNWLVEDERIAMISFTGSPPVGKAIKEKSGFKKVSLELGSNSAVVVDETADLNAAVAACVRGGFSYAGQSCISVQRIYAQEEVFQKFQDDLVARVKQLKLGDPLDQGTDLGPMITENDAKRIESWVNEALQSGAKLLAGGKRDGSFYQPTVLTSVSGNMKVVCQEVFAPLVSLIPYKTFGQALEMVNDSAYGLQAGIFTTDLHQAFQAVKKLNVGGVMINDVPTFRADNMPYGGVKQSGMGREGVKFALEEMTQIKMVSFNLKK